MSNNHVLVTGAAGFIGSHTVLELLNAGYKVTAIDNFSNSISDPKGNAVSLKRVSEITGKPISFKQCDLLETDQLQNVFEQATFNSVIHLAALKAVGESVAMPLEYYTNNIVGSLNLIKCCKKYGVKDFVFSSSATVYGTPSELPIKETASTGQGITNPYGRTKYFVEQILFDLSVAEKDWNISILRYFNPAGAHPSGLIGEDPRGIPNNLMPFVCQVAAGKLPALQIYGTNFDTPDGSGIRDYIHIVDLAKAHVAALDRIRSIKESKEAPQVEVYNIGTGKGYSVKEMVAAFEKACGHKLNTKNGEPRPGDLACVYCDPTLAHKKLGWKAEYGIEEMCETMWRWQTKNPNGFSEP
ncbi:GDP-mannose 4,6 dehydratase domain-containing protein [Ditylenchus destructor]|nr:GDP-mannose 4,6 dehydratase domain-containing protein [Ditylenchus destructor]